MRERLKGFTPTYLLRLEISDFITATFFKIKVLQMLMVTTFQRNDASLI